MRVQMQDFDDSFRFALYGEFFLDDAGSNYTLSIGGYYGNAGTTSYKHVLGTFVIVVTK